MSRLPSTSMLVTAAVALAVPARAQDDMRDVQIRTVAVTDGVYMLMGRGGNIGLSVGDDGAFVIDDQYAPLTEKIKAAIAAVTDHEVRFVVNTHWHGDHTGGNENFGEAGAIIVAHENVRKRLNPAEFREVMGRTEQQPPAALPLITFTDALTFHWNGDDIEVFHVEPAHTDGDAVIRFADANVLHMGDLYFNGRYPFIDVESGGTIYGVIAAAERVLRLVDSGTKIIPGHGELSDPAGLRAYRDMLLAVRDRVQEMINEGRTEDEVVAARPTRDFDATWSTGSMEPERFVRLVYQGMMR